MTDRCKKILVTGGAGYIGSLVVSELLESGYFVRVLDNLTYGRDSLSRFATKASFELHEADLRDTEAVTDAIKEIDSVIHLAAVVGDPQCSAQPELAVAINKVASEQLCQQAIDTGVGRFIFASTCSNYGVMPDDESYVAEDSPLNPVSLYAETKVGFESYLLKKQSDSFAPVCLRFATAYGLSPRPRFDLTVNEFTRDLTLGKHLDIYGPKFWRPYCHTTDIARACRLALEADSSLVAGQAFNVGSTVENYTKQNLIDMILEEVPEAASLVHYVQKEEDLRNYKVSFDRIANVIGFEAGKTVPDGIKEIVHAIRTGAILDPENPVHCNT